MKRISKLFVVAMAALLVATGIGLASNTVINGVTQVNYQFVVNDNLVQLPQQLMVMSRNNITYVPLRFLSETMGIEVDYIPGTVTLNSEAYNAESSEATNKKIQELQTEIDKLKAENNQLKEEIKTSENISAYRPLPTYAEDAKGFRVAIYDIAKHSTNDAVISLRISNSDIANVYYMDPFKTEITVDGKVYKTTTESGSNLYTDLGSDRVVGGDVVIRDLSDIKDKKIAAKFYYKVNNFEEKTLTVFFDTSK